MSYGDIAVSRRYRTNRNDMIRDFYVPVLKESVLYKRAVGFFSSTALIETTKGISGLIRNGGKMQLIVSPLLSEEDMDAIAKGCDERKIIESALLREFKEPRNTSDEERLNWLATLAARNRLEIRGAFMSPQKSTGMYHEKTGILYDAEGNKIAFTGSMNETANAFHHNFESIVVFNSLADEDVQRVMDLEYDFDSLWAGREPDITVIDVPDAIKEKLVSYQKDAINLDLDRIEMEQGHEMHPVPKGVPCIPGGVTLHDYQKEAINRWAANDYCGIFDMATGTGKTYTGLGAAVRLFSDKKRMALFIVCPYQHLVEQWVEDVLQFHMMPTTGYSASRQKDWKERLSNDIMDFKLGVIDTFCFVTTNATFSSDYVQKQVNRLGRDTLLIVDEAHNFGAANLSRTLNPKIEYRLALSATLERHGDPEGTQALYDYFGDKCIEYGLERAIREDRLTPYYYHPRAVYLTEAELGAYRELSRKIAKQCYQDPCGKVVTSELGKKLLIQRSRVVAGASNKVLLLKELMQDYKNDSHILIYCGAARSSDYFDDPFERDEEGERQIVAVSKMLGIDLGMKVTHFTSSESASERERIKKQFADADPYQALVAIKCLDEGVNIPGIKTAFILASSTNPKEYIQRRGRVLRKAPGKQYAVIYDFITLPTELDYVSVGSDRAGYDVSLIKREIMRMKEFGEMSKNPSEADRLIKELEEAYGLDTIRKGEYSDE